MNAIKSVVMGFICLAAGLAGAKTVYVATNGSDSTTDGTNPETPFLTVAAAYGAVGGEGDEIVVKKGKYVMAAALTVANPVTIRSESGKPADVIFDGNAKIRPFVLKNAGAKLLNVCVQNGNAQTENNCHGNNVTISGAGGTVEGCILRNATFTKYCTRGGGGGGGISCSSANGLIVNCIITNNTLNAEVGCQGVGLLMTAGTAVGCFIAYNKGKDGPKFDSYGAVHLRGTAKLVNCTIAYNSCNICGGVDAYADTVSVVNCLIWKNTGDSTSDVYYGKSAVFDNCVARLAINEKCFAAGDAFVSGAFLVPTPASPCRNASIAVDGVTLPAKDVLGNERTVGTAADIGCCECQETASAAVSASPAVCLGTKTTTLAAATTGLSGITGYTWDFGDGTDAEVTADPTVSHTYADCGFYHPTVTVSCSAGDVTSEAAVTTVSVLPKTMYVNGKSASPLSPYATEEKAAETVTAALAVAVDGQEIVVLKEGSPYTLSAGAEIRRAVTLRGETGKPEDVVLKGGNIKILRVGNPQALVHSLTVQGATKEAFGNGVMIDQIGGTVSNCIVRNCSIPGYWSSAAAFARGSNSLFTHCIVTNNSTTSSSTGNTKAIGLEVRGSAKAVNCLVADNYDQSAKDNTASGAYANGGTFRNCTIVNNRCRGVGGIRYSSGTVENCVLAKNTSTGLGNGYHNYLSTAAANYVNCATDDDVPINDTCQNAPVAELFESYATGNFRVATDSVLIDNGKDYEGMETTDLAGEKRRRGTAVDIGCYEYDNETVRLGGGFKANLTEGFVPVEITFTATVTGASDPGNIRLSWDFDGDGDYEIENSTALEQPWLYESGAAYDVKLLITDIGTGATFPVVKASFLKLANEVIYVSNGNEGAKPPYGTRETAAATIADALAIAIADQKVVVLKSDRSYGITKSVVIDKKLTLCGETGNPEDVRIAYTGPRNNVNVQVLKMNAEGACAHSLALCNGYLGGEAQGAGVLIEGAGGTVSNCVVRGSRCDAYHTVNAVHLSGTGALMTHCVVSNNTTSAKGDARAAGVGVWNGAKLSNTLVCGNRETVEEALSAVGGVWANGSGSLVENCTIVNNSARRCGGVTVDAGAKVRNCVIAGNKATTNGSGYDSITPGQEARFANCACDTLKINETCVQDTAANLFNGYINGDYSVATGSKLIDAGAEVVDPPAEDIAGLTRIMGRGIDIGAWEYDSSKLAVGVVCDQPEAMVPVTLTFTATLSDGVTAGMSFDWDFDNDGTVDMTTETPVARYDFTAGGKVTVRVRAYNSDGSREAVATAQNVASLMPKTIYVKNGNAENEQFPYASEETAASTLRKALNVALDGNEIVLLEGTHNVTDQISIGKRLDVHGVLGDPSKVVVRRTDGQDDSRAGFLMTNERAVVHDLTFDGAFYNRVGWLIEGDGGTISNCVLRGFNNWTYWATIGAVTVNCKNALVTHCVITNNVMRSKDAGDGDKGIVRSFAGGRVENCLIAGNSVEVGSWPVLRGGAGAFVNCTVVGNGTKSTHLVYASGAGVTNCIFAANTKGGVPGQTFSLSAASSACKNNLADTEVAGWLCEPDAAKVFVDPTANDWHLPVSSPARDRGSRRVALPVTDLDGNPRRRGRVDLGCYENPVGNGMMLMVR